MAMGSDADAGAGSAGAVLLGDRLPDQAFTTDQGSSSLLSFDPSNWLLLFSYPKDMTPVCATEMAELAKCHEEFTRRGVSLLGLCVGTVEEHLAFVRDVEKTFGVTIRFPVIADVSREVVRSLGVIHPRMRGTAGGRHSVRSVIVASPVDQEGAGREVELLMHYPPHIGRDTRELLRCVDALLRSHADPGIGTPANWQAGEDVLLLPAVSEAEAARRAEARAAASAPGEAGAVMAANLQPSSTGFGELRPYLRLIPDPGCSERGKT